MKDKYDPSLFSELSESKLDPLSIYNMIPDNMSRLRERHPQTAAPRQAAPTLREWLRNLFGRITWFLQIIKSKEI